MNNDVVIYQSADGLVKIEAMIDPSNETIWATQKAMAELFGVTVPNISYHFKRIFTSGELEPEMVIKEILITAQSGVRGLSEEKVKYYNLDAILSLGYRVNSVQATAFRKWATSVLKQYMLKGYVVNHNVVSEQKHEENHNPPPRLPSCPQEASVRNSSYPRRAYKVRTEPWTRQLSCFLSLQPYTIPYPRLMVRISTP